MRRTRCTRRSRKPCGLAAAADHADTICAGTAEVQARRRAFLRKRRLRCPAVAASLEEAGDLAQTALRLRWLSAFLRLPPPQRKSARTTNAIERLHERKSARTTNAIERLHEMGYPGRPVCGGFLAAAA